MGREGTRAVYQRAATLTICERLERGGLPNSGDVAGVGGRPATEH